MIFRYLIALLGFMISLEAHAQHFLEKSFLATFTEGTTNQVAYIEIPVNVNLFGTIEIQITGGYNSQLNRGVLTKRIDIVYAGNAQAYLNQESEVTVSSEPLASYWAIGDFDPVNSRIPIYHLNSKRNDLNIKVKMQLIHPASIPALQSGLTLSMGVAGSGGIGRSYRNFNDARIGIGTKTPEYRLDIVGTARAHEIRVNTQKTADFVFEPDYKLPSLDSVAAFVKDQRHLPGIPSAKQMEKEGINLGELQIDLLQKIEELTLHVIELDKKNKEQGQLIETLLKVNKLK